jgi:hypothetical protein
MQLIVWRRDKLRYMKNTARTKQSKTVKATKEHDYKKTQTKKAHDYKEDSELRRHMIIKKSQN